MRTEDREPLAQEKTLGVRERSKRERQDRIILAARNMFAEHGYDATTLRQVAQQAGLGLGTLFNYISDKRDLIYLIFNREASLACEVSLAAPRSWQSFPEKIVAMIEPNYRMFGSEPVLSRILLSEVLQHTPGFHLTEHIAIRDRLIRGVEVVVAEAQGTGEIGSAHSPGLIARHIFFTYSAALRWWLASEENPTWRSGLRDFAEIVRLQMTGLDLRSDREPAGSASKQAPARMKLKMADAAVNRALEARRPKAARVVV